jgi:hypothetical protein
MWCKFNIKARQTGKTTDLINYVLKHPIQRNAFIVAKNSMKNTIIQRFNHDLTKLRDFLSHVDLFTAKEFIDYLIEGGSQFDAILIDEYLFFTEHEQSVIYSYLNCDSNSSPFVKIESTPKKLIDPTLFNIVKSMKEKELGILEVSKHIKKEHQKELYYLWFNFLSDPETTIRYEYQEKNVHY